MSEKIPPVPPRRNLVLYNKIQTAKADYHRYKRAKILSKELDSKLINHRPHPL
jgi:hypothetical protein